MVQLGSMVTYFTPFIICYKQKWEVAKYKYFMTVLFVTTLNSSRLLPKFVLKYLYFRLFKVFHLFSIKVVA